MIQEQVTYRRVVYDRAADRRRWQLRAAEQKGTRDWSSRRASVIYTTRLLARRWTVMPFPQQDLDAFYPVWLKKRD